MHIKQHQKFWNSLAKVGENSSVIDPMDKRGFKNQYIAMIRTCSIIEKLRDTDRSVLDFGCGTGGLTEAISQAGKEVTGIDISKDLLALTKTRKFKKPVNFIEYSKLPLPLDSHQFDAITIYAVLQYIKEKKDLADIFSELHRILKKGGRIIFMEQCRRKTHVEKDGYKVQRSVSDYLEIIEEAGFKAHEISIKRYGRFPLLYLVKIGLINNKYFPLISRAERKLSTFRGIPNHSDYAEVLFLIEKK